MAARAPASEGFRMPAEFAPHDRCLICWPTRSRAYWGDYYLLAQATYAAVARAIAAFEPVLVIADVGEGGDARAYCGSDNIEVVELPIDDSWVRDSGPIFLLGPDGELAAADFLFNSWGERYLPYDKDAADRRPPLRAPRRAALRGAAGARGRLDHGRRRGDPHHHRELPAQPEPQPAALQGARSSRASRTTSASRR